MLQVVLLMWLGFIALIAVLTVISVLQSIYMVPRLADTTSTEPPTWPALSVVIPACDEASTLESALQTLLVEDYPSLEVVLINDRSTDGTGAVIDRLADRDPRIKPIHIRELPEGWLGKVHALDQGVKQASHDWILITDADVHYKLGTIRRAVAYMLAHQHDFLTMFPRLIPGGPLLNLSYTTFLSGIVLAIRAWEIPDSSKGAYTGIGHFMMMRREAFAKTPGFAWLRMEVVDDAGLGLMMKRFGASCAFLNGAGQISLRWYSSFLNMAHHLEKNMFGALSYYSYSRMVTTTLFTAGCLLLPIWAVCQTDSWVYQSLGCIVFASSGLTGFLVARWFQMRALPGLFILFGSWCLLWFQWRSALQCWRRNGIVWRGTHYPLAALRKGLRIGPLARNRLPSQKV